MIDMIENEGLRCTAVEQCPLCGSSGKLLYRGLRDLVFGAPGEWSFRRCTSVKCGCGWVDPRPIAADIGSLYRKYHTHEASEAGDHQADDRVAQRRKGLKYWLGRVLPHVRLRLSPEMLYLEDLPPGRVLDVGCGAGKFLAEAARSGWQAFGLDFDPDAIRAANARQGVNAKVGDIADVDPADGLFDAIVLDYVIEHVPNPTEVFARAARLLAAGGRLVMLTPNMDALGRDLFGGDWRGLEIPRHLVLFTRSAFLNAAREAGFQRIQCFSSVGRAMLGAMLGASAEIAIAAGRPVPRIDVDRVRWRSILLSIIGRERGEWLVLIAHKSGAG